MMRACQGYTRFVLGVGSLLVGSSANRDCPTERPSSYPAFILMIINQSLEGDQRDNYSAHAPAYAYQKSGLIN